MYGKFRVINFFGKRARAEYMENVKEGDIINVMSDPNSVSNVIVVTDYGTYKTTLASIQKNFKRFETEDMLANQFTGVFNEY